MELKTNNAVFPFEKVSDIQEQLRKQWAGYMYERLTQAEAHTTQAMEGVFQKLDRIEAALSRIASRGIAEGGSGLLDISKMAECLVEDSLKTAQDLLVNCLDQIMLDEYRNPRGLIKKALTGEDVRKWLDSLVNLLKKYKWAKTIPFDIVFGVLSPKEWWTDRKEIPYEALLKVHGLWDSIAPEEKDGFCESVLLTLRKIVKDNEEEDDIPL